MYNLSHNHQTSPDSPNRFLRQYMALFPQAEFLSILQRLEGSLYPQESREGFSHPHRSCQRFLISSSGQGFIFPGSSQRFNYPQLSRIYFPQQCSKLATYAYITFIYIINIDKTHFIASYISCDITLCFG